jgi:hypothetical protein
VADVVVAELAEGVWGVAIPLVLGERALALGSSEVVFDSVLRSTGAAPLGSTGGLALGSRIHAQYPVKC